MFKSELRLPWIITLTLIALLFAWTLPSIGEEHISGTGSMDIDSVNTKIMEAQDAISDGNYSMAAEMLASAAMMLDEEVAICATCPMWNRDMDEDEMAAGITNCPMYESGSMTMVNRPGQNRERMGMGRSGRGRMMDENRRNRYGYSGLYCPTIAEEEEARCFIDWLHINVSDENYDEMCEMVEEARTLRRSGRFMEADRVLARVHWMGWDTMDEEMYEEMEEDFEFGCPYGEGFMMTANRARNRAMAYQNQGADVEDIYDMIGMAETSWAQNDRTEAWEYLTGAHEMLMDLSDEYETEVDYETGVAYSEE